MNKHHFIFKFSFTILVLLCISSCDLNNVNNFLPKESFTNNSLFNSTTSDSTDLSEKNNFDSIQKEILVQNPVDSTKNYVYLTFDDGPYKGSEKINQIIQEEQVKATVFIVGMNAYTDALKQYLKNYEENNFIEIANHTYSHANRNKFKGYYSRPEIVLKDIERNDSIYHFKNRFVRLPGRNVWNLGQDKKFDFDKESKQSSNYLAENNYYTLGWDYEWNRINKKRPLSNPNDIYDGIIRRLENKETFKNKHLVILMHDDMFDNDVDAEKLRTLIKLIKSNKDIILETASNYPINLS